MVVAYSLFVSMRQRCCHKFPTFMMVVITFSAIVVFFWQYYIGCSCINFQSWFSLCAYEKNDWNLDFDLKRNIWLCASFVVSILNVFDPFGYTLNWYYFLLWVLNFKLYPYSFNWFSCICDRIRLQGNKGTIRALLRLTFSTVLSSYGSSRVRL